MRVAILHACVIALLCAALPARAETAIRAGDRAWVARAETLEGELADSLRIEAAIDRYRAALADDSNSIEARWKLLRALHYLIDFSNAEARRKDAAMEEAIAIAKHPVPVVEGAGADVGKRAALHFWSAIAWGVRAKRVSLLTVVREGVAAQIRADAEWAVLLDHRVDRGGPLRLLSRLHAELPRVPLVSSWVDREKALPLAERAHTIDPNHPGNRLILALALLERGPERRAEGLALLRDLAALEPTPESRAEELAIRKQARERLRTVALEAA